MYFSKATGGFYSVEIHGDNIPADAVEITIEQHAALLEGQSQGKIIGADGVGNPVLIDPPAPTQEQVVASYSAAVQSHMDAAARAAGYDNINTVVSYAEEPAVAKFQVVGAAFRAWRSLCWAYCYTQLDAVEAQERTQPTIEELITELPPLVLP